MDPVSLLSTLGAAGALLYVLKLIVDGKLHASSEVDGLRKDKADLLRVTEAQGEALRANNEALAQVLASLRELAQEVRDEPAK
jgi:hypothetical protein